MLLLLVQVPRARISTRRVGLSLVYHRLGPASGRRAFELVPALAERTFERHMRLVAFLFAPVTASELTSAVRQRRRGQRIPIAVTFDDDLTSHASLAMPILRRVGVAATFFLCGRQDAPIFWWEALQAAVDLNVVGCALAGPEIPAEVAKSWTGDPSSIHDVANALLQVAPSARDLVLTHLLDALHRTAEWERARYPSSAELAALSEAGFEIGFHTARHDYLPTLNPSALKRALEDGLAPLQELSGQAVAVMAYPHGAATSDVVRAARSAGFIAAFTTTPKPVLTGDDEFLLGRLECLGSLGELAGVLSRGLRGPSFPTA